MDIATFSQLGIGLATLFILWLVVKYFIEVLTKKEQADTAKTLQFTRTINKFNKTINNHIDHNTQAQNRMSDAIVELTKAITGLKKK